MSSISKGWSTSFIYKQDLTSYYMNSLLRSVIRPGIYNANMGICNNSTATVGDLSSSPVCLLIKRGTTFVFSNDYWKENDNLGYRRNFNHADPSFVGVSADENFCLIKCVALSDMKVALYTNSADLTLNSGNYSIHAYIKYNPLDTDNMDTNSPTFLIVNHDQTNTETNLYENVSIKRASSEIGGQSPVVSGQTLIIDGNSSLGTNDSLSFYLNVGFFKVENVTVDNETVKKVTSFTGRGLPEYRYSPILDSYKMTPDIIPDFNSEGTLYFDIPESFVGTTVIKNPDSLCTNPSKYSDWEGAYLSKRKKSDSISSKITFSSSDTGVFAVYGFVSNSKSYSVAPTSISNTVLKFGKCLLPNLSLPDLNPSDPPLGDVPLDVSYINAYSLLDGIQGKDIWSYVIDHVRDEGPLIIEGSGQSQTTTEVTDIIPMALVTVNGGSIDHSKTLSYFGLQERLGKINTLNVREPNIFNVIPVME